MSDLVLPGPAESSYAVVTPHGTVYGRGVGDGVFDLMVSTGDARQTVAAGIRPGFWEWFDAASEDGTLSICYRDRGVLSVVNRTADGQRLIGETSEVGDAMGVRLVVGGGRSHVCWWRFQPDGPAVYLQSFPTVGGSQARRIGRGAAASLAWSHGRLFATWAAEDRREDGRSTKHVEVELVEVE